MAPYPQPGHVLIAHPNLTDRHFGQSVVFLLEHHAGGALGLIINRPLSLSFGDVWDACPHHLRSTRGCCEGGPLDRNRGLLLHRFPQLPGATPMPCGLAIGGSSDSLAKQFPHGPTPQGPRLFLGHASWGPGQLTHEIRSYSWSIRRCHLDLVTGSPPDNLWQALISAGNAPLLPGVN